MEGITDIGLRCFDHKSIKRASPRESPIPPQSVAPGLSPRQEPCLRIKVALKPYEPWKNPGRNSPAHRDSLFRLVSSRMIPPL